MTLKVILISLIILALMGVLVYLSARKAPIINEDNTTDTR